MAVKDTEWLSLIEVSGPFLVPRVLEEVFPQGLERVETPVRHRLREAYEEWREAVDTEDSDLAALHRAWTRLILEECLEYDDRVLVAGDDLPGSLSHHVAEHGETIRPDLAVVAADRTSVIVPIFVFPPDTDLERPLSGARWPATPLERATMLCRATGVRIGLVTDGERWTLVHVTRDGVSGHASWYARLWWQEPITLQAFRSLLGVRRHFGPDDETLPTLLDRSLEYQDEVTDRLGEQVLHAVEVLVQALDRADQDRQGELLHDVSPRVLYEAALTVMMRLVFLLAAEERGLLLLDDPLYDSYYAISTLRAQLRERADREGLEVLERRWEAWSRLLATFRAVFAGVEHPRLRMSALGGSLFDPDRFPFLEGRPPGSRWRETPAHPLPIDDRTVLLLLESLQVLEDRGGARLLSYRGLDVEQIGYVYEGLLEHTVARISEPTLGLRGSQKAPNPNVRLSELESARVDGETVLVKLLEERTGRSASALRNDLRREVDAETVGRLLLACGNDQELAERVRPFVHLLRNDVWGYPLVYRRGAMAVTHGADRRETGSHYTPKSLTEAIVAETLEPLVYVGPAEGRPRNQWTLRSPAELLDLKVCDPAMGSGAFLVQVCRYFSERLVEAWGLEEDGGRVVGMDGLPHTPEEAVEPIPKDEDERLVIARRLVAERCLYGVDVNPLAVELAKLSIWLVTLSKGRPLEFLDHNLRCGDSLLGIRDLDQLLFLDLNPGRSTHRPLFAQNIEQAVEESLEWRRTIRATPIRDVRDVRDVAEMEEESRRVVEAPRIVADALVGLALASGGDERKARDAWLDLSMEVGAFLSGDEDAGRRIAHLARKTLATDLPVIKPQRRPFHWPLEFPEVFQRVNGGFDAIVGNPPFMGNRLWKKNLGEHFPSLARILLGRPPGKIDLCVLFHRRAVDLLRRSGTYGLLAQTNIAEGSAIDVGLGEIVKQGDIYWSRKGMPWPGRANVITAIVCFYKDSWRGSRDAEGNVCDRIGPRLEPEAEDSWAPKRMKNRLFSFEGVHNGKGLAFVIGSDNPWFDLLQSEPDTLLRPYVTGDDITSHALLNVQRWALDIGDRSLREIEGRWPQAYRFLMEVVRPTRTAEALKSYKGLHERWWQFWNHRAELFRRLREEKTCVAFSKNTKYPICIIAPSSWIYTNKVVLIGTIRPDIHCLCLSSFLQEWLYQYSGGKLGLGLTISIREGIDKFPRPGNEATAHGLDAANRFNEIAVQWSRENGCGLTEVMNAYHSPETDDPDIQQLRDLHRQIDEAVAEAYGWDDLNLEHGFHEVDYLPENDCVRWTISEKARFEVLRRLAQLNKERYEEEVRQGLHGSKATAKPKRVPRRAPSQKIAPLFSGKEYSLPTGAQADPPMAAEARATYGTDSRSNPRDEGHARAILAFLEANPGWHAKSAILSATGIPSSRWNAVINELLAEGRVVRQGERRGTRYRVSIRNGG